MPCIHKVLLSKLSPGLTSSQPPASRPQSLSTLPPAWLLLGIMCGSKAASPGSGPAEEINGDHILSPHFEVAHRLNVSIVLSSGAITLMLAGLILYCLIKNKVVRCCVKDNPAHVAESGGMNTPHQPSMRPQSVSLPSAPTALQLQAPPLTHNIENIENSLARMQLQYSALASQLASQQSDQKTPGASGAPRLNQYPMV